MIKEEKDHLFVKKHSIFGVSEEEEGASRILWVASFEDSEKAEERTLDYA